MIKDFSATGEEYFLKLIDQVQEENYNGITDWIGDRWLDVQGILGKLKIQNYVDNVSCYHKKVLDRNNTSKDKLRRIFQEVRAADDLYAGMVRQNNEEHLGEIKYYLQQLCDLLDPNCDNPSVRVNLSMSRNRLKGKIGNPVIDGYGSYGGNQGSAKEKYLDEELQKIVRKYYPKYSDAQIKEHLEKMNNEGCGYVAICNTIFEQYVGREAEFEEKFGFPMYKNGDLNYDALIVDFYCDQDNPLDSGTNQYEREKMWEAYLKAHGIYVDVQCDVKVTPENYETIVKDGQLIVSISPVILQDENGNRVDDRNGGHAMTVTGVTSDGRYIVSSWGRTFYVDPDDPYNRLQFQQVKYDKN